MLRSAVFLLAACFGVTAMAAEAIKGDRQEVFGDIAVHYNTFNSTYIQPDVARGVELVRSKDQGVINVSVVKADKPLVAQVSGKVKDLTGKSVALNFKQITEPGAIYYLAQYPVPQPENRIFEITVTVAGDAHTFSFNQELFPGE
ncbi:DUF4426 domain-containing protein [Pseudomonas gingeri]|uniref:DUF4426 domain-containing protein n=1 Tax=Pseudomonas gingeri TaxID=117681 RepID=UPI0015A498B2|nr:DUF4426 domain-containing protein [Pseudomonas gingeri]NWA29392.1 DUF4426 domain-containing protein [Pseudomonas gingeri]NWD72158.1 DUF4426 domain-containing protein [Pseudomonas gingeri]